MMDQNSTENALLELARTLSSVGAEERVNIEQQLLALARLVTEPPQRNSNDTPQRNSNDTPQRNSNGAPQWNSNGTPQRSLNDTPQRNSNGAPQWNSNGTPQRSSNDTPQRNSNGAPQWNSNGTPQRSSNDTPQRNSNGAPQWNSNGTPQHSSNGTPQPHEVQFISPTRRNDNTPQRYEFQRGEYSPLLRGPTYQQKRKLPAMNFREKEQLLNHTFTIEQVILMPTEQSAKSTPTEIGRLKRLKLVKDLVPFYTYYREKDIMEEITKLFPLHLTNLIFTICRKEGSLLNPPCLKDGEPLTGDYLKKWIHNKKLFILPSKDLNLDIDEGDGCSTPSQARHESKRKRRMSNMYGEYVVDPWGDLRYYSRDLNDDDNDDDVHSYHGHIQTIEAGRDHEPKQDEKELLRELLGSLEPPKDKEIKISVTRGQVLANGVSFLMEESNFNKFLKVEFTDLVGVEEEGRDYGGPRREFYDQCIDEVLELPLLGGELEKKIVFNEDMFEHKMYFYVAVIFSMSIMQGGPSPTIFSADCYSMILSTELEDEENLKKAVDQFRSGLDACGLLEKITSKPNLFKQVFLFSASIPSFDDFGRMLKYNRSQDITGNDFAVENKVIVLWKRLLAKIERRLVTLSIAHILSFASGSKRLPALGYTKQMDIIFNHANPEEKYPIAGACALQMTLPILRTNIDQFDQFATEMEFGIRNSLGYFGML